MNKITWRPATADDVGMLARFWLEQTPIPAIGVLTDVDHDLTTGRTLFARGGPCGPDVFYEAEVPERELSSREREPDECPVWNTGNYLVLGECSKETVEPDEQQVWIPAKGDPEKVWDETSLAELRDFISGRGKFSWLAGGITSYIRHGDTKQANIHMGCLQLESRALIERHFETHEYVVWKPINDTK